MDLIQGMCVFISIPVVHWSQLGADINGEASGDYSGDSVSLSSDGTIVAIGAYRNDVMDSIRACACLFLEWSHGVS